MNRRLFWLCWIALLGFGELTAFGQRIEWNVSSGKARIAQDNQTVLPVTVEFSNKSPGVRSLTVQIKVVDYFQRTAAEKSLTVSLNGSEKRAVELPVVTDEAGPYVKVVLSGSESGGPSPLGIDDEQLIFTEVLTGPRLRMSLNGEWEMYPDESMNVKKLPAGPWKVCELPYRWITWGGIHTYWFRKQFTIPSQMKGKNIELQLNGVRFHVDVFLNGRAVGKGHTDQLPFNVNLTRAAKPGEKNELLIAVTDWVSCGAPELLPSLKLIWSNAWYQGREVVGMPFIRPCTMGVGAAGISDPIYIVATSSPAVEGCYITPSFRKSQLTVKTVVRNDAETDRAVKLKVTVFGKDYLKDLNLKPGRNEVEQVIPVDLKTITLWWPGKPFLYRARAEILQGDKTLDRFDTRFGFREFWADGPVFRINGIPIKPNAAATFAFDYPALGCYDELSKLKYWYRAKKFLRSFFNLNVNLLRYHSEPHPILMLDQADEVGMMIVSEAFMSTLPGKMKMDDPRLWKNLREFYPKWVYREFNHPSLVIRSMENELGYHLPPADQPRSPWGYPDSVIQTIIRQMKDMGRLVKSIDPSRPIMYEGSGPVFYDVADIYNIHYPGIPGYMTLFPITGRRLSIPADSYIVKKWLWDRKKPLYVGEYDSCFADPKAFAPLLGDKAYSAGYMNLAHGDIWSYSIPGQRIDGMTAGVPWSILAFNDVGPELNENTNWKLKLFKNLTEPVASFIHQYREVYFGGKTIARTITTLNDTLNAQTIKVRWSVVEEKGRAVQTQEFTVNLGPAESKVFQIKVVLPKSAKTASYKLTVESLVDNKPVHQDVRNLFVYPEEIPPVHVSSRMAALELPTELFNRMKLNIKKLDSTVNDLKDIDVLFVPGNGKGLKEKSALLEKFILSGGRLVIMGGSKSPDYLPFKLNLAPKQEPLVYKSDTQPGVNLTVPSPDSTMTIVFPRIPEHPLLKNMNQDLLRFWREDHLTADYTYVKPKDIFARAIIDCGAGFSQTPLVEIPWGKGLVVAVELPVLEAFEDQPAAGILLANLLEYVDRFKGQSDKSAVGVLAEAKSSIPVFLQSLNVEPYLLGGRLATIKELSAYNVIIIDPTENVLKELTANKDKITLYVNNGGTVWLYKPLPAHLTPINALLPVKISLKELKLAAPVHALNRNIWGGVSNDELFWPEGSFLPTASPRVAGYTIETEKSPHVVALADPVIGLTINSGKGKWFIDEVAWSEEYTERTRVQQYVRMVLTNLGVQVRETQKAAVIKLDPTLGFKPVDISTHCNEGFLGGVWNGPSMGLHKIPLGLQNFKGVLYNIIDPAKNSGKSCIGFYSKGHNKSGVKRVAFPVGRKAACVHLLVTSIWTSSLPAGTKVVDVDIEYTDGTHKQTEICHGRDVLDWCPADFSSTYTHPAVVWVGPDWPTPGLYDFQWLNPNPEKPIKSLTFSAANDVGFVVLVAVTTQERMSEKQKKKSDWIPGLE